MARARNIKPSFFNNDELAELEPLARLLFIGMWTIADFKGCFEYKPKRVKVQLLPYDDCDIESLAINLDKSRFISIYSVQGQLYVKVLNFDKHQNPHKNERDKGSDIPDISEADFLYCEKSINNNSLQNIENNRDKNGTTHDKNGSDRADSLNLIPDSPNTDTRIQDKPVKFVFKKALLDLGADSKLIDEWIIVRKNKKASNTETSLKLFLSQVEKAKIDLNLALKICVDNSWGKFNHSWMANINLNDYKENSNQAPSEKPKLVEVEMLW